MEFDYFLIDEKETKTVSTNKHILRKSTINKSRVYLAPTQFSHHIPSPPLSPAITEWIGK